jgi:hypothetical protein
MHATPWTSHAVGQQKFEEEREKKKKKQGGRRAVIHFLQKGMGV